VIQAAGGSTHYPDIRRINGNVYTQFLREVKELVKSRGKSLSIQLYSQMLMPDDRLGQSNYIRQISNGNGGSGSAKLPTNWNSVAPGRYAPGTCARSSKPSVKQPVNQ